MTRSEFSSNGPAAMAPTGQRTLLVLLALCVVWAPCLLAQQGPDLPLAESMIAEGRAAEAYEMLAPFEDQLAGDLTYDYLLARSALDSGRPSIASFIYERILAVEPDYAGVRFESGRAYLELENFARAKQEFETVLRFDNLPPDLRTAAERYAAAVDERLNPKRTAFNGFMEYGLGYDDNINSAIAEAAVPLPGGLFLLLDPLSRKRKDTYNALSMGGEVIHALDDHWQLIAGADYRGRLHFTESTFDYHDVEGRAGVGYVTGAHNFRLSARGGRFVFNDEPLRDVTGLTFDWLHAVNERNQISVTATWARYRFDGDLLKTLDFDTFAVGASWNHAFAQGRGLATLAVNGGYEEAKRGRIDGDRPFGGFTLSVQGAITDTIGVFAFGGMERGVFKSKNDLFQVRRNGNLYTAGGGLTWSFAKNWALRPQINWSKNQGNVSLSDYDRYDISLNLRRNF